MPPEATQTDTPESFSLGGTMDRIASQRLFSGHPADTFEALGEGEENKGPDQGAQPEGGDGSTPEGEKPPEKKEEPKFKHASWEETEKARLEAEQKMHSATEEAARTREENEGLKKRLEEMEVKPPATKPQETASTSEIEPKIEQALSELAELDEEDPDYNKKAAKIWAKAGFGGAGGSPLDPKEIQKLVDQAVEERLKTEKEARDKTDREERDRRNWERAVKKAGDAGLDMTEGSDAFDLFAFKAGKAPKEGTIDEQIDWAINEVQRILGVKKQAREENNRRARANQNRNAVLEKGGSGPGPETNKQPQAASIGSILSRQQEARRI